MLEAKIAKAVIEKIGASLYTWVRIRE